MYKPTVPYTPQIYKNFQTQFGGYNHTSSCGEGEIYDMKNIGHEEFPVLTPRRGRISSSAFDNSRIYPINPDAGKISPKITEIYAFDKAYVVEKGKAYDTSNGFVDYLNRYVYLCERDVEDFEVKILGNNYDIATAMLRFNADIETEIASINKYVFVTGGEIFRNDITGIVDSISKLTASGKKFEKGTVYAVLDLSNFAYGKSDYDADGGLDEVFSANSLNIYTWNGREWEKLPNREPMYKNGYACGFQDGTYQGESAEANTMYKSSGFPEWIQVGDAITISGCTKEPKNNQTVIVREISEDRKELHFYENTFTLGSDGGMVSESLITIDNPRPDMDFICSCNNRLFGCKGDTIYACKLGDPYNWNVFDGVSTDSYSVEVGSSGDFTGCCAYEGDVLFFKENIIYKLLYTDSSPENWSLTEIEAYGVKEGCRKSLAVADGYLFWYSPKGMMKYGGSLPVRIAEPFGDMVYTKAVGGSDTKDYYVCLTDTQGVSTLFVYDTAHGIWFKHDEIDIKSFVYYKGELTALVKQENGDYEPKVIGAPYGVYEDPVGVIWAVSYSGLSSMIEFGDVMNDTTNRKNKLNISVTAETAQGSELKFYVSCDGEPYELIGEITGESKKQTHKFSYVPTRCDYYRLKIEGTGFWRIYAISNGYIPGSDS